MAKPIIPITRSSKFFSFEDYDLDISMGREAIEGDVNTTVVLYRVNHETTQSDNIYNEAPVDGIKFFPPIELKIIGGIGEQENKDYNGNGTLRYSQVGPLSFGIYNSQLVELKTEIIYGDYIGYPVTETQMIYFSVVDDGAQNFDNKHTIMGFKPAFRTIKCVPVDAAEFRGV